MEESNARGVSFEQEKYLSVKELTHKEKMIGIIKDPVNTFVKITKFPPRITDWLIPLGLFLVVSIVANILYWNHYNTDAVEHAGKYFQDQVVKGEMSQMGADREFQEYSKELQDYHRSFLMSMALNATSLSVIIFFLVSVIFYGLIKFGFKGEGTFTAILVPYGLSYYVLIFKVILIVLIAQFTGDYFKNMSLNEVINYRKLPERDITEFLMGLVDVFTIWALAVTAIGTAGMFKPTSANKYIIAVFGLWILWEIVKFLLHPLWSVPFFTI